MLLHRIPLMSIPLFALGALCAPGADAQTPDGSAAAQEEPSLEVIVTGSRIARTNDTTSTPLQVLSAQSLADDANFDIGDSINQIPAVSAINFGQEVSNTGANNAGVTAINLRGLGENRTLTLVNGRRYVSGVQNQGIVDLSTIPSILVERMEVTTGGASAVYGSDAIGGVLNIILRRKFEGLEFTSQYGQAAQGDGESHGFSLLAGTSGAEGRISAMGYASFNKTEPVSAGDRDFSKDTIRLLDLARPQDAIVGPAANSPVTGRQTIFFPNSRTASAAAIRTVVLPDGTLDAYDPARDGLNVQDYRLLLMPSKRYMLGGNASYQFSNDVRLFLETNFARTETLALIQPTFFQSGSTSNIGGASPNAIPVTIPVDNPFIPQGIRDQIPSDRTEFGFGRLLYELGGRGYAFRRHTYRGVVGFDGELESPTTEGKWRWEAAYGYGRTSMSLLQHLASNVNMYDALRVESDGAGGYQCASASARARGCLPINLFTGQALTEPELNYLRADGVQQAEVGQRFATASISGDLFALPAGPFGMAAGVEWRKEDSQFEPDSAFAAGLLTGAQQFPVSGDYSVKEAFVEVNAPVLKDAPFARLVELEAAFRTADYTTVGRANAWTFGGSWKPVDDLRLRAVKARAVRAPNIGELYAPPTYGGASALDPCAGGGVTTGLDPQTAAARQAYCASLGIGSDFVQENPIIYTYSGGNTDLDAEIARTLTFGLVLTPRALPRASFSVDYYEIDIDNAIEQLGTQTLLDQCANTADSFFCDTITRDPVTQTLLRVDNQSLNVSTLRTSGLDVQASYGLPWTSLGADLAFALDYTHLLRYETRPVLGADIIESRRLSTYPADRANLRVSFDRGPWRIALTEKYIGKTLRATDLSFDGNAIPAYWYTDMQVRFSQQRYSLYVGLNNLFDKQPPVIAQGYEGNIFGYNTDPRTYDTIGRYYYAGLTVKF